ncbi:replicative DNA helicase [Butyrivibrio sp. LC3010]|uniref:replicative DNA helicase n=1 Tax=Butyrivibrio sp. LC3010 TaxID=1280680 RepID=UPI00040889D4|nr:replicative DNA helicase [Butyrivibrio sp. LC3010]
MDNNTIRKLPHNISAEQSVVGAMMIDGDSIQVASDILFSEDFYDKRLGLLFEAMVELHQEKIPVDEVTLQNRLKSKNAPPQVYDAEYILGIAQSVPYSGNVKYYANIVKDKSKLRQLIHSCEGIIDNCYSEEGDVPEIMHDSEKEIYRVAQYGNSAEYEPISHIVMKVLNNVEEACNLSGYVKGLATGFTELDYMTSGLQNSDFILIAARPSMGKTAFVLNVAQHMAFKMDYTVAIFSLEMPREQLVSRLMSMESRVDSQHMRKGEMSDTDWENLIEGADVVGRSHLIIDDTPGISIQELQSKCRKYKSEDNLQIIMIDYLQLMNNGKKKSNDNRQQEISDISRALKSLARELDVPVVALSQLSRAVEQRPDHRPMLSDLRESGAIEQDADVAMFIYRDDYYNKDSEDRGVSEIIIAKQRNGPIGTVKLKWLPEFTKFANLERPKEN